MRTSSPSAIRSPLRHALTQLGSGALLFAFGCAGASAQNLVPNGSFDAALTGWQIQPQGVAEPSTIDIEDSPASGSALLRNDAAGTNVRVYPLRQCIQVFTPGNYFVGGYGRLPVGQTGGRLVFSYNARFSADCTSGLFSGGGNFITTSASWGLVEFYVQVTQVPASFEILLGLEKTPAGGVVTGNFDEVHLVLDDLVFSDAFE
jgi:hypothetical protein